MPFTTVAFSEENEPDGTFQEIDAVPDPHINTEDQFVYVPPWNRIIGANALLGAAPIQCRLQSPSIRRINPYYINVLEAAITHIGNVEKTFHPNKFVSLTPNEQLECEVAAGAGDPRQVTIVVFLADSDITEVNGEINQIYFTCEPTLAAGVWAFSPIDLPDGLPVGHYQIVGARLESATSIAFRFIGHLANNRPGGMCVPDNASMEDPTQRKGGLGIWMEFDSVQLPGIEVIDSAATGPLCLNGYMDVVLTG
jgi:hypothetical protein